MKLYYLILLLLLVCSLLTNIAIGATVHGIIYDFSLNKVNGAGLSLNTTPEQYYISIDGRYSFEVSPGFYNIKAVQYMQYDGNRIIGNEERNITIVEDGDYIIDFILFPSLEEEDEIAEDIEFEIPDTDKKSNLGVVFVIIFLTALVIIIYIIFKGKNLDDNGKKEEIIVQVHKDTEDTKKPAEEKDDIDTKSIIEILEKEGGRATQKQIRKYLPLSEAKISLMVTELEHKGLIEKIKKGRGNILILNKK